MFTVLHQYTDKENGDEIQKYFQCDTYYTVVRKNGEVDQVAVITPKLPCTKDDAVSTTEQIFLSDGYVYLMNEFGKTIAKFYLYGNTKSSKSSNKTPAIDDIAASKLKKATMEYIREQAKEQDKT